MNWLKKLLTFLSKVNRLLARPLSAYFKGIWVTAGPGEAEKPVDSNELVSIRKHSIVGDIGILASQDPVTIDKAAVDLVNGAPGNRDSRRAGHLAPGEDKFRSLYPEIDWEIQLEYGEEMGLGSRTYELIPV